MSSAVPPDIRRDMAGWFAFHDPNGKGLSRSEVMRAILSSLGPSIADPRSLHNTIEELWTIFDTDGNGVIDAREFAQPGGLGEAILAHMHHDHCIGATPPAPPVVVGVTPAQVDEIHVIFPHIPRQQVEEQLIDHGGDKEATINALLLAAAPPPPVPQPLQRTEQCSNCRNNSTIQIPTELPTGTTAVAWVCGTCQYTNHASIGISGTGATVPHSALPPPVPNAPDRDPASAALYSQDESLSTVPTGLPAIASKQCTVCNSTSTIQLPSIVAAGVRAVAWRCPSCSTTNQVPIIQTLDSSDNEALQSSALLPPPIPIPPPAGSKVPTGLPAESTQQCANCRRNSRIGLPGTVDAGITAVAWRCPTCQHSNEVPIRSSSTAAPPPPAPVQAAQKQIPTGLPRESRRQCGVCRNNAKIQLPAMVNAGVQAVAWRCPTCQYNNEVPIQSPGSTSEPFSVTGAGNVRTGLPAESRRECSSCRKFSRVQLPAEVQAGIPAVAWRCPKCKHNNEIALVTSSQDSGSNNSTGQVFRPRPGLREQAAPVSNFLPRGGQKTRRALLVGINYRGSRAQLRGCINDVKNMYRLLTQTYNWPSSSIKVLADENISDLSTTRPTRSNILKAMQWLVADVMPGDALFFHFSGHGAQQPDPHGVEEDGMNETIVPVDFQSAGMIADDEISKILVQPLPEGVRLTAVMDCCHSGTGLDLPYTWTISSCRFTEETNPYHTLGDVQLFSGCEDGSTSADAASVYAAPGGAMTTAFCEVLRGEPCPTYVQLLQSIHRSLQRRRFRQRPQLSSSQRFDFDRPFLLEDAVPNSNRTIGRTMRKKFKTRKKRYKNDFLFTAMGVGAGAIGGLIIADMLF